MLAKKSNNKPRLSKGILEMKFMQRTKVKVLKENEAAEGQTMYSTEITDKMLNSNSNFIFESSYVSCENLLAGRLSFRGMNPDIEKQLKLEQEERLKNIKRPEQPVEVSDDEMLKHYNEVQVSSVSKTIGKKFSKYKNNSRKKEN